MKYSTESAVTLNHVIIEINKYDDENSFFRMTIATCCMVILIACGFWCICASCQLKNEDTVYHHGNEFQKDEEQSKTRSKGGKEKETHVMIDV